jgi:serine/threonine-protein kinase
MEFITGKTLADALKTGERMSLDRVCEIGQRIAEALGYAHQRGVVHRDIKPANILLTSKQVHGIERPKITDFGVAKFAAGQTTMTGQVLGTPAFMPPEQITGATVDGRADLFSLGVVLYWMATGEQPFPGESITAVSYKVVHTEPVPPRKLNPAIPFKLESIILKCLAKSPEDRYQTGEELARDLGELRAVSTSIGLKSPPPEAAAASDPNATLIETPAGPQTGRTIAQPPAPAPASKNNSNNILMLAALALILVGGIGVYALRHNSTPPPAPASGSPSTPSSAPASADNSAKPETPAADATPAAKPAVPPAKPETKPVLAEKVAPPKAAAHAPAPKPEAAAAEPAALDFNPKTLDPKANARLKIDALLIPPGLDFTVELNGKLFLRRSAEANKSEFDDFYVPPGVQEFHVTASSGAVRKSSNTVSLEFSPRKRHTLKIELRTQGAAAGAGVPQGLYPDSQIVLTLK